MRRRIRSGAVLLAVLAAVGLAGCTSGARSHPKSVSASSGPGGTVLSRYPVPPAASIADDPVKKAQTTITSCAALPGGGWRAIGSVHNTGNAAMTYTIVVFFMDKDSPVNFADTYVKVAPNGSATWVAEKRFGTSRSLSCRLTGVG
jgi:hypothetical protein